MFENATMLDETFLKNEFDFCTGWSNQMNKTTFRDYYINICACVNENNVGGLSISEIEKALDTDDKKYLFKTAQAKQLMYDMNNGRGSMIRGEEGVWDICRDTISRLNMITILKRVVQI